MACKDAFKARTSSLALLKNKKIKFFKLQYRTKLKKNSMYIPKDAVKSKGVYYTLLGETKFKENLPIIEYDCRLIEEWGEYFLCVPYKQTVAKFDNQEVLSKAVAIDQGVRSFITYYSEDKVGKIGNEDHIKLFNLCKRIDGLISKTKLVKGFKNRKKRKSYKKAINRLKTRLHNLVDELHWKSINYLVNNYNVIICPNFNVSNMVIDDVKRKITSKTVRNMLNFRFYTFKQRLKLKCKEIGCVLIETSEEYTSQITSWTGEIIKDLGGSKEIKSEGVVVDRDYNGARNIFIKSIQENLDTLKMK
jgi:putative transposase